MASHPTHSRWLVFFIKIIVGAILGLSLPLTLFYLLPYLLPLLVGQKWLQGPCSTWEGFEYCSGANGNSAAWATLFIGLFLYFVVSIVAELLTPLPLAHPRKFIIGITGVLVNFAVCLCVVLYYLHLDREYRDLHGFDDILGYGFEAEVIFFSAVIFTAIAFLLSVAGEGAGKAIRRRGQGQEKHEASSTIATLPLVSPTLEMSQQKEELSMQSEGSPIQSYQCTICNHIYDPALGDPDAHVPPGTPFKNLPETWTCPDCGSRPVDYELFTS